MLNIDDVDLKTIEEELTMEENDLEEGSLEDTLELHLNDEDTMIIDLEDSHE